MLSETELSEIREHLERSQNPLFYFDNDVDGLCSFIIFQKSIGRGKGVAIKSFPELNKNDLRKVDELKPDYVFILDKPRVSNDFLQAILEKNIPIVWIDHHIIDKEFQPNEEMLKQINYFNSAPSCEPTTYLAYKTFRKKDLQWLSLIGCIGDNFLPDFAEEFA